MRSYEERAKNFIAEIFPYIQHCGSHYAMERMIDDYNRDHNRKVAYCHGLTRFALVTSDYVVKVDYNPRKIAEFGGCEKEIALYEEAESDGFAYLFAKITRFDYMGNRFYIMPRVHGIGRFPWDAWEYMTAEEADWCNDHNLKDLHNFNYGWKEDHVVLIDYGAWCE